MITPVDASYLLVMKGLSPHVISRRREFTYSSHVLPSGNVILSPFGVQEPSRSSLETFLRPNQTASAWLSMRLQIHDGVNTSANVFVLSARIRSVLFTRGSITSAVICSGSISDPAGYLRESVAHRIFRPVVLSFSREGRRDATTGSRRSGSFVVSGTPGFRFRMRILLKRVRPDSVGLNRSYSPSEP